MRKKELLEELKYLLANQSPNAKRVEIATLTALLGVLGISEVRACNTPIENKKENTETSTEDSLITSNTEENSYNEDEYIVIKVQKGDTLTKIAKRYETTVEEIVSLNDIKDPNKIYEGLSFTIRAYNDIKPEFLTGKYIAEETIETPIETQEPIIEQPTNVSSFQGEIPITQEDIELVSSIDTSKINYSEMIDSWSKKISKKGYTKGIDISHHQNKMDLNKVLNNNDIDFVMIRSGYFLKENPSNDEFFEKAKICVENNIPFGTYFWPSLRGVETTELEMNSILEKIELLEQYGIHMTMPIALDFETKKCGGSDVMDRIMKKDPETLESLSYLINTLEEKGYYVMVYTSESCSKIIAETLNNNDIDVWMSKYYYNDNTVEYDDDNTVIQDHTYPGPSNLRQYAQTGKANGYNGNLDLNRSYVNFPQIMVKNGLNHINNDEKKVLKKTN